MKKKKPVLYDAPIEIFFEYQFLMKSINDYLLSIAVVDEKLNVKDSEREFLNKLNIHTFKDIIEASRDAVEQLYQNKRIFKFFIEVFAYLYYEFECNQDVYEGIRAVNIIQYADSAFLERPINIYLVPQMYTRLFHVFKNHKKRKIQQYKDLKRYMSNDFDTFSIHGVGIAGDRALCTIVLADFRYWKSSIE